MFCAIVAHRRLWGDVQVRGGIGASKESKAITWSILANSKMTLSVFFDVSLVFSGVPRRVRIFAVLHPTTVPEEQQRNDVLGCARGVLFLLPCWPLGFALFWLTGLTDVD